MSVNIDHGSSFEGDRDLWVNLGGAGRKDWELELWHDFSLPVSRLRPCLATPFSRPRWVRSFSSAPPKTPLDFRMSEFVLIYGRRSEFQGRSREIAAEFAREDEFLMTFDRLSPEWKAHDCLCVEYSQSRYQALSFPATVELSPYVAPDFAKITGKEQAARRSTWLSPQRRKFLLSRLAYWDDWAQSSICDCIISPCTE